MFLLWKIRAFTFSWNIFNIKRSFYADIEFSLFYFILFINKKLLLEILSRNKTTYFHNS